jgi:hypothetical protein
LPTSGKGSMPYETGGGHGARLPPAAWWEQEVDMVLSSEEERVWDDVQRFWLEEADEPPLPRIMEPVPGSDVPTAVVVGVSSTVLLLLFGAVVAALVIAGATALGWALWRRWSAAGPEGAPARPAWLREDFWNWPADDRWAD